MTKFQQALIALIASWCIMTAASAEQSEFVVENNLVCHSGNSMVHTLVPKHYWIDCAQTLPHSEDCAGDHCTSPGAFTLSISPSASSELARKLIPAQKDDLHSSTYIEPPVPPPWRDSAPTA